MNINPMAMMPPQAQQMVSAPQQQIIDPRAQYERQSQLADMLMAQSGQYAPNSGIAGALAMMASAYAGKQAGQKAEGALSSALEQEAKAKEAEMQQQIEAASAKRKADFEDAIRLAAAKEQMSTPALIKQMQAAGIDPNSAEGRQRILQGTGPQTSVNVNTGEKGPQIGTIPQGFQLVGDSSTGYRMEPIPGSEADVERQQTAQKAEGRAQTKEVKQGIMQEEIGRALQVIEQNPNLAAGPLGALGAIVNVGPGNRLESPLDALKPNIAFDRLDEMRQNSPTGGAVGQLSDSEREALGSVFGSLRQSQHPDDLAHNLRRLNDVLVDAQHGTSEQRQKLVKSGQIAPEINDQIESLYQGGKEAKPASEVDDLLRKYGQ